MHECKNYCVVSEKGVKANMIHEFVNESIVKSIHGCIRFPVGNQNAAPFSLLPLT